MRRYSTQQLKQWLYHVARRCLFISTCLVWGNMHAHASNNIFMCVDADGHKVFTDLGCSTSKPYQPPDTPTVEFTPLDSSETAQLQALSDRARKEAIVRRKYAQRQRKQQAKQADRRDRSCRQVIESLERLEDQRRKGYALTEQPALEQRQASLKARKRLDCS